jgi:hypothetical protein
MPKDIAIDVQMIDSGKGKDVPKADKPPSPNTIEDTLEALKPSSLRNTEDALEEAKSLSPKATEETPEMTKPLRPVANEETPGTNLRDNSKEDSPSLSPQA